LPVYGQGENVRDWLYVEDHAPALRRVLSQGRVGATYNIGGRAERTNLEVVKAIYAILDQLRPDAALTPHASLITFVTDRPGHDRRYAIDDRRIADEFGWRPQESFETGLRRTVEWYLDNPEWVEHVKTGAYREWIETNYASRGVLS
jgi:dTDP-glucose 4,6-dehydratase